MLNPYSKDSQLQNAPGNRRKRSASEKGADAEKEVKSKLGGRRNHQGRLGGGLGNPDISSGDLHIEVKNTAKLELPKWLKTLKEECPPNKKPALVFVHDNEPWLTIKLEHKEALAQHVIEQAGLEVF